MEAPIRLLIVDDSAFNRRLIAEIFADDPAVEVVGKAADGEEALRLASTLKPDVITCDLEMPRMDGFTFLRILMAKQPTPVLVVSSYSQKENVFKALELGALDFIAKPDRQISPDAADLREQILLKVKMIRSLRPGAVGGAPSSLPGAGQRPLTGQSIRPSEPAKPPLASIPPRHVIAIASSTGGPTALLEIFGRLRERSASAVLVAQHMPDKFTRSFAERLDRKGPLRTAEAQDGDRVVAATGFVCPGRRCMELVANGNDLSLRVGTASSEDRYVPSADKLLTSVAKAVGRRAVAVILTGMGDDGVEGARAIRAAGGLVIAESQESAVVFGMPGAAVRAGIVDRVLSLSDIAATLAHY
ncbi:MAG: chemotaxis response regulator protein-glutamate methylesterase [Myxococcales bacterium]|nr:chemotaxis response regulator protein-glutamate methylesterase [Myxococcales bacterium]